MMYETPLEITFVPPKLRESFTGILAEAASGTTREREDNFLSRALAAYTVHKLAACTLEEAANSVVDGGGDNGIDAVYHAAATNTLWIVQSKYITSGRGEPDLGGMAKFKLGMENLLNGEFDAFAANAAWQRIIPRLRMVFGNSGLQVRAVVVYSGIHSVSEDRRWLIEGLTRRYSPGSDYLRIHVCNLTTIYDWLTNADAEPGVAEVQLKLLKPGWVTEPYETVYGMLPIEDLVQLYRDHAKKLIAANIRAYKGDTEVNAQIAGTLRDEPEHFFYLNNGLTAYCTRLEVNNLDRANAEEKRVRAFGFSIVNGAQTLGSVAKCFANAATQFSGARVFIKVISLRRCDDDRAFAERITRSTNYQNQIGSRDFVALDEQQERLANQLTLAGITYHYKEEADAPGPDLNNFTLEEATEACACLLQQQDCDFISRLPANRRSLWSFEEVYPDRELYRSRYAQVFRPDRSARTVWRAVQAYRIVKERMRNEARSSVGVRKAFFENARWLVLNMVYLQLRPEQGEALAIEAEQHSQISRYVDDVCTQLWAICEAQRLVQRGNTPGDPYVSMRHFKSVFSNPGDCQALRNALLASLNAPVLNSITAPQPAVTE